MLQIEFDSYLNLKVCVKDTPKHLSFTFNNIFGAVVKNPPAGDMGSSLGPGRSHMPQSN